MLDEWDSQLGSLQATDMESMPVTTPDAISTFSGTFSATACQGEADIKTELAEEDLKADIFLTETSTPSPAVLSAPTTICVRRPFTSVSVPAGGGGRSLVSAGLGRQLPVSNASAMRSPVISRGVCYTRTGGLGVTRCVPHGWFFKLAPIIFPVLQLNK